MQARPTPCAALDICALCTLRPFVFYTSETDDDVLGLRSLRKGSSRIPAKSSIYREGEPSLEYFTIFEGWAFSYKLIPDGRRQILSFLLPGDSVSFQFMHRERLHFSEQALTDVSLCYFDRRALARYVAERPRLVQRLDRLTAGAIAAADDRLTDLGRRSAHERIAVFFLQLSRRLQQRGLVAGESFPFPVRQQHIADALGLTSVHVSRVLKDLKADGMLSIDQERLTIHDPRKLKKLSGMGDQPLDERLN